MTQPGPHTLRVKQISLREIRCDIPWVERYGVFLLLGAVGAFYAALTFFGYDLGEAVHRPYLIIALGVWFIGASILRVHRVTIDLRSRTYQRAAGFWPFVERRSGSLAEFEGVTVARFPARSPVLAVVLQTRDRGDLLLHGRAVYVGLMGDGIVREVTRIRHAVSQAADLPEIIAESK